MGREVYLQFSMFPERPEMKLLDLMSECSMPMSIQKKIRYLLAMYSPINPDVL
jgi:hypothetical protein